AGGGGGDRGGGDGGAGGFDRPDRQLRFLQPPDDRAVLPARGRRLLPRAASPVTGGSRAAAAPRLAAVDSLAGRGGPPHHELRALLHRDTAVATPVAGPGDRPGPGRGPVSLGRLLRPLHGGVDDPR